MLRTSNVAASRVCARRPAVALQSSPTYLHHGRRPSLLRVAASAGSDEPERDCLSTGCEETDNWNAAHLGTLRSTATRLQAACSSRAPGRICGLLPLSLRTADLTLPGKRS